MSSVSTDGETAEGDGEADVETSEDALSDREQAIDELRDVRDHARYKAMGEGRIRSPEKERVRIQYLRVLVHAVNSERQVLKDRELEDMMARLEELEERIDSGGIGL